MKWATLFASLAGLVSVLAAPLPDSGKTLVARDPPGVPSAATARTLLSGLTTAAMGSSTGYDRSLFRHWISVQGTCDAREMVLSRDGSGVNTDSACQPTSGSWYSQYDGVTVTASSSVDIDHMVPLAHAWRTGAASWTAARREQFANDLSGPQLWAVSASSNRSKGDRAPDVWKPTRTAFHCVYARAWVRIKATYALTVSAAERTALTTMLNTC